MSRFLRVLIAITAGVHLPFVAAVGYFGILRGWSSPWTVAWIAGALGVLCFVWRARAAAIDQRGGHVMSSLVDTPYFIHWCACMWCMFPALGSLFTFPIVEMVAPRAALVAAPFLLLDVRTRARRLRVRDPRPAQSGSS